MQQSGPLSVFASVSLRRFFDGVKVDETGRVVEVHPDGGALGNVPDVCVVAVEPQLVAGAAPPETPGLVVFSQPALSVAPPPPGPLAGDSGDHPSRTLDLPVSSDARDCLFAKDLGDGRRGISSAWNIRRSDGRVGEVQTYLGGKLVSLRPVQDGTSDIICHARHLGSALRDPQQLIGCLVIQGKVNPVCATRKTENCKSPKGDQTPPPPPKYLNLRSYVSGDRLCMLARGCRACSS